MNSLARRGEHLDLKQSPMEGATAATAIIFAQMNRDNITSHFRLNETKLNGTKSWECLSCAHRLICAGHEKLKHHVCQITGEVRSCKNPHPEMKIHFSSIMAEKQRQAQLASEPCTVSSASEPSAKKVLLSPLMKGFAKGAKDLADQSVLMWLAAKMIPPHAVQGQS